MPITCGCGAEIQDGWTFCYVCASPLPDEEELERRALAEALFGSPEGGTPAAAEPVEGPSPEPRPHHPLPGQPATPRAERTPARAGRPAGPDGVSLLAHAIYAGMLVASVWLLGLAFGMPLPGPDGTSLPPSARLPALPAAGALFILPEILAWPLARSLAGGPPDWAEARRGASARFQRLLVLRLVVVLGALLLLTVSGASL